MQQSTGQPPDEPTEDKPSAESQSMANLLREEMQRKTHSIQIPAVHFSRSENHLDIQHALEHREKLLALRPRFLTLDPRNPEQSPDLLQLKELYTRNLVSDKAFEELMKKNTRAFEKEVDEGGGMLNKFQPDPDELKQYPVGYHSVQQQIIADLLPDPQHPERSLSGTPGTYHIIGLFDVSDVLRTSLSFRLPPCERDYRTQQEYQHALHAYVQYLESILLNQERIASNQMIYEKGWDLERMRKDLPATWEIDTYNVQKGYGGAAAIATRKALQFTKDRFGKLLNQAYCYRFRGLAIEEEESGRRITFGPNRKSRKFLEGIGFTDMAILSLDDERVVRKLSDGQCHDFGPSWQYMRCGSKRMQEYLKEYMVDFGIIQPHELLLTEEV